MTNTEMTLPQVLIIDDDQTVHLWAKRHLTFAGFKLISALSGDEGVALFQAHFPDIVLVDVEMPGMDGFEACAKIRELPNGKNTPILMVTGTEDTERVAASFDAGATDFVVKPVNWKVLVHRIGYMVKASSILHQLEKSQIRLSKAQKMAKLGHWELNLIDNKLYWSDEIFDIFHRDKAAFIPDQASFLNLVDDRDKLLVAEAFEKAINNQVPVTLDYQLKTEAAAPEAFVEQQIELVLNAEQQPIGLTGTIQDISERIAHERQVRYLAYYDEVTKLPNRACFLELLNKALELSKRHERQFAILYMDLDGFKAVNDMFGHAVGDLLLQEVAHCITEGLRRSDIASRYSIQQQPNSDMARLGGDEFTILLNELTNPEDAALVASNIQKWLAEIKFINEHPINIGASIGIAMYPQDGEESETLLKNADVAMYYAKKLGKNQAKYFHEDMNVKLKKRQQIESCMNQAIEKQELRLYYQPIVNAITGLMVGAEALMRWQSEQLGFMPPNDFIPLAEENGMIVKFGEWAIREVCRQHKEWEKHDMGHLKIAVNISSIQFDQPNFISMVEEVIKESAVNPNCIVFELTESLLMSDTKKIIDVLWQLKKIGLKLSIDDFGTGYSSLSTSKISRSTPSK